MLVGRVPRVWRQQPATSTRLRTSVSMRIRSWPSYYVCPSQTTARTTWHSVTVSQYLLISCWQGQVVLCFVFIEFFTACKGLRRLSMRRHAFLDDSKTVSHSVCRRWLLETTQCLPLARPGPACPRARNEPYGKAPHSARISSVRHDIAASERCPGSLD